MAVNYLQYIGSVQQGGVTFPNVRFLVSGVDSKVRQIVGQNIVSSAYDRGRPCSLLTIRRATMRCKPALADTMWSTRSMAR